MSVTNGSKADFMQGSKTMIENAIATPELASALSGYGYDSNKLAQGKRLWEEADALFKQQSMDRGGKEASTADLGKSMEKANATYAKSLKVARVALADDAKAIAALKLYGPRKQSVAGWLDQATTFYANLASEPALVKRLSAFGYSIEKLKAEASLVDEVRAMVDAKAHGAGTAQTSTVARDKKLRELDDWVSDFRTIARVAFYESPQELEKLGVMALNVKRPAKKSAKQVATQPETVS